jgi:hypothetical protein
MEINMEIPQQLKTELPHNPVISLLGIYPKECTPGHDRVTCTPMFIVALFTIAKLWKPRCPTTKEWIRKMWYNIHNVFSVIKKNEICCLQVNGWNWRTSC